MFKMGCSMAKKILAIDKSSNSGSAAGSSSLPGGGATAAGSATQQSGTSKVASGDELGDFSKLEQDPRLPLNVRQVFKITKSWKAIARTMSKTGTAMFLNLFEQNQDLFYLFDRFQHLKGKELHDSMELREHASTVMSTLDQSINSLSDYDNFVTYLHSIGKLHRKVPGFKREHFWKIEQPFLKAVKQTLDERCNETIEEIYKIAIKLIIETIADGYGQDGAAQGAASGPTRPGESGASSGSNGGDGTGGTSNRPNSGKGKGDAGAAGKTNHGADSRGECRKEQKQQHQQRQTTLAATLSRQLSGKWTKFGGANRCSKNGSRRRLAGAKCDEQRGKHRLTGESMMEMSSRPQEKPLDMLGATFKEDKETRAQVQVNSLQLHHSSQVTTHPQEASLEALRELLSALIASRRSSERSNANTVVAVDDDNGNAASSRQVNPKSHDDRSTAEQLSESTLITLIRPRLSNEFGSVDDRTDDKEPLRCSCIKSANELDELNERTVLSAEVSSTKSNTKGGQVQSEQPRIASSCSQAALTARLQCESKQRRQQQLKVEWNHHLCERNKLIHLDSGCRKSYSLDKAEADKKRKGGDEGEGSKGGEKLAFRRQDNEFAYASPSNTVVILATTLERPQSDSNCSNSTNNNNNYNYNNIDKQQRESRSNINQPDELSDREDSAENIVVGAREPILAAALIAKQCAEGQAFQTDSRPTADMAIHLTTTTAAEHSLQCRLETSNGNMGFPRDSKGASVVPAAQLKCSEGHNEHTGDTDESQSKRQQQQQHTALSKLKTLWTCSQFKQSPAAPTQLTPTSQTLARRLLPNRKHRNHDKFALQENKLPEGCSRPASLLTSNTTTTSITTTSTTTAANTINATSQSRCRLEAAFTVPDCKQSTTTTTPTRATKHPLHQHRPRPQLSTDPGELVELIKLLMLTLASRRAAHNSSSNNETQVNLNS